ncbi:unnamed protein product [Calypogeia fissa]
MVIGHGSDETLRQTAWKYGMKAMKARQRYCCNEEVVRVIKCIHCSPHFSVEHLSSDHPSCSLETRKTFYTELVAQISAGPDITKFDEHCMIMHMIVT